MLVVIAEQSSNGLVLPRRELFTARSRIQRNLLSAVSISVLLNTPFVQNTSNTANMAYSGEDDKENPYKCPMPPPDFAPLFKDKYQRKAVIVDRDEDEMISNAYNTDTTLPEDATKRMVAPMVSNRDAVSSEGKLTVRDQHSHAVSTVSKRSSDSNNKSAEAHEHVQETMTDPTTKERLHQVLTANAKSSEPSNTSADAKTQSTVYTSDLDCHAPDDLAFMVLDKPSISSVTSKDKGKGKAIAIEEELKDGDEVNNVEDNDHLSYTSYTDAMEVEGDEKEVTNKKEIDIEYGNDGKVPYTTSEKVKDNLTVTDTLEDEKEEDKMVQVRLAASDMDTNICSKGGKIEAEPVPPTFPKRRTLRKSPTKTPMTPRTLTKYDTFANHSSSPGAARSTAKKNRVLHVKKLAKKIDHYGPIRKDDLPEANVIAEILVAKEYGVRAVVVRPDCVRLACETLSDCDILVCAVIGYPFTFDESVEGRWRDAVEAIRDGADEILLIPVHRFIASNQWPDIHWEVNMLNGVVKDLGATMNVMFENKMLDESIRIRMGGLCAKLGLPCAAMWPGSSETLVEEVITAPVLADEVGHLKMGLGDHGTLAMIAYAIYDYEDIIYLLASGVQRIGTTDTAMILEDAAGRAADGQPLEVTVKDTVYRITFENTSVEPPPGKT